MTYERTSLIEPAELTCAVTAAYQIGGFSEGEYRDLVTALNDLESTRLFKVQNLAEIVDAATGLVCKDFSRAATAIFEMSETRSDEEMAELLDLVAEVLV